MKSEAYNGFESYDDYRQYAINNNRKKIIENGKRILNNNFDIVAEQQKKGLLNVQIGSNGGRIISFTKKGKDFWSDNQPKQVDGESNNDYQFRIKLFNKRKKIPRI